MSYLNQGGILSATFNPLAPTNNVTPTVEYLVVGGGGAGGGYATCVKGSAGGGGAGGFLTNSAYTVTAGTTYNVVVGQGGAWNLGQSATGGSGGNSSFGTGSAVYTAATSGTITAYGGGYGGHAQGQAGGSGGSGGGGGQGGNGGAGTSCQGYAGANSSCSYGGGGGGGAGGVGRYALHMGGIGGPPVVSNITGYPVMYAAGGGGASDARVCRSCTPGSSSWAHWNFGGGHIGGNGAWGMGFTPYINAYAGSNPMNHTGSGGGGALGTGSAVCSKYSGSQGTSGAAGIVVIRYPQNYNPPTSVIGATLSFAQGYRIYTWTVSSGSITF